MLPRFFSLILIFCSTAIYADCRAPIKMAALTWESGQFTSALIKQILELGYDCEVTEISGSSAAQENAVIQNDLQLIAEVWVGRSEVLQQGLDQQKVQLVGNTLQGGAQQGWYIPAYLQQQYPDLTDLDSLSQYAHLFVTGTTTEKGRFLNCPTGWACQTFNQRLLENTGLLKDYQAVLPGTGAALDAEIASLYQQKKPILFYYWQPTGFMAKYNFVPIQFPAYREKCWNELLNARSQNRCVSGFPSSTLSVAVSQDFAKQNPEIIKFLEKIQLTPEQLNLAILEMTEQHRSPQQQAEFFLQQHPALWSKWLSPNAAEKMQHALQPAIPAGNWQFNKQFYFPDWDIQQFLNTKTKSVVDVLATPLRQVSAAIQRYMVQPVITLLIVVPAWLWIVLTGLLAWHSSRQIWFAILSMFGLFVIGAFGLWAALIQTTALLFCAVLLTVIVGVPVGIWMAFHPRSYRVLQPVLDVMQTMPSFVYLIPILMLFGLGYVPAVFATMIYAIAPLIRLTALGITQIDSEIRESAEAFGTTPRQRLFWVILPLARPSMMVGLNQTVMMSLSMVVLASMIGAPGLGENVLIAIQTLNVGQGLESGSAIVILAIIIDRISQAYGRKRGQPNA